MFWCSTLLVFVTIACAFAPCTAQDTERSTASSDHVDAASHFEELAKRYKALEERFRQTESNEGEDFLQRFLSDHPVNSMVNERKYRLKRFFTDHPMNSMVDEFLQLEEQTRGSKIGFSCLYHLVLKAIKVGDADCPVTMGKRNALELLGKHYADYPDIDTTFRFLFSGARIPESQSFLRKIIASSSKDYVRANAMYELANNLALEANFPAMIESQLSLLDEADPKNGARLKRLKKRAAAEHDIDSELNRREAANLIKQINDEFSDQLVPPLSDSRTPVIIEVERGAIDQILKSDRERLVNQIPSVQFELKHGIGQPAPSISGNDALGNPMSLADFHGKVVVLMFSFKGCGPCEAMYPDNRKLIEELKDEPFAFIGVQGDESIDTVVESIDSEAITWRVWWDGQEKPISTQWNIMGWPSTFVLDKNGVLRFRGLRGKELANAVTVLLER